MPYGNVSRPPDLTRSASWWLTNVGSPLQNRVESLIELHVWVPTDARGYYHFRVFIPKSVNVDPEYARDFKFLWNMYYIEKFKKAFKENGVDVAEETTDYIIFHKNLRRSDPNEAKLIKEKIEYTWESHWATNAANLFAFNFLVPVVLSAVREANEEMLKNLATHLSKKEISVDSFNKIQNRKISVTKGDVTGITEPLYTESGVYYVPKQQYVGSVAEALIPIPTEKVELCPGVTVTVATGNPLFPTKPAPVSTTSAESDFSGSMGTSVSDLTPPPSPPPVGEKKDYTFWILLGLVVLVFLIALLRKK